MGGMAEELIEVGQVCFHKNKAEVSQKQLEECHKTQRQLKQAMIEDATEAEEKLNAELKKLSKEDCNTRVKHLISSAHFAQWLKGAANSIKAAKRFCTETHWSR